MDIFRPSVDTRVGYRLDFFNSGVKIDIIVMLVQISHFDWLSNSPISAKIY